MVNSNLNPNNNIFSTFPQYNFIEGSSNKNINTINNTQGTQNADKFQSADEKQKSPNKLKKIIFGSTLASTIITAGVLSLIFAKGFHGSAFKNLSKLSERLAEDLSKSSNQTKGLKTKTVFYAKKGTKKVIDTMQATSNFTAIKDRIADKILKANRFTRKFADTSTNFFKKVVDRTLGKKYDKVGVRVKDITSILKHSNIENLSKLSEKDKLQKITIKGQTRTLGEWINLLSSQTQRLETNYDSCFSLGARRARDKKRMGMLADLPRKINERFFKDKNSFFNPQNYKTYATEDLTRQAREELKNEILKGRKQVTNNIPTIHDEIRTSLNSFTDNIRPEDTSAREIATALKKQLEKFKNCSGVNEASLRQRLSKEISKNIDNLIKLTTKNKTYSPAEKEAMLQYLSAMKETVMNTGISSKGALEEIMTILKGLNQAELKSSGQKIVSDKSFKEMSKLSSQITKGLEKATNLEAGEYFLKQAEMTVGSAPTDVLSILFPIGVGTYAIAKGEDKEEKISASLTTCIPLIGTFATFVYGTSKMLSGAKNLGFSLISGAILSKAGNYCDKLYKKYKTSGSVATVVKDEYDNFWTGITPQYAQPLKEDKETK